MDQNLPLTQMTAASGCAAKVGPGTLTEVLKNLPNLQDERLLVGYDSSDDACVYRINEELAVIQTVDFFTPIVDDPYLYGQIAAANALSDVYAMGGQPRLAMNLLCVPGCLPKETIRKILEGGHDKAREAGCVVAGGHTIQDHEPKYGLSVTGFVHPERILKNIGAQPGDVLVLTKPLGTGILTTGAKVDWVSGEDYTALVHSMATLNAKSGKDVTETASVHACTDVTGFGLLGHGLEMAKGSDVTIRIRTKDLPLLSGAKELAEMGIVPTGAYRNMDHVKPFLKVSDSVEQSLADICADPQTSGGLLVALPEADAQGLLEKLRRHAPRSAIVGRVESRKEAYLILE